MEHGSSRITESLDELIEFITSGTWGQAADGAYEEEAANQSAMVVWRDRRTRTKHKRFNLSYDLDD
jgi:hypothetical protein